MENAPGSRFDDARAVARDRYVCSLIREVESFNDPFIAKWGDAFHWFVWGGAFHWSVSF